jgi:Zn-dependent protease with chaperone function
MFHLFPGVKLPFYTATLEEISSNYPENTWEAAADAVANVGGACASFVTSEALTAIKSAMPESMAELISQFEAGYTISVQAEIFDQLSQSSKLAVLLHEEGHVILDHLSGKTGGLLINLSAELEADEYASKIVGKSAVRAALLEIPKAVVHFRSKMAPAALPGISTFDSEEYLKNFFADSTMMTRLAALS